MNNGLIIVFVVALVALGPLLAIWSVNTLFHTSIAYTFTNWLAMIVLLTFIQARVSK